VVAFAVKGFGGMTPRADSSMLPDNAAEQGVNCDLSSGVIDGFPAPEFVVDLSDEVDEVRRAYRFPGIDDAADVWIPLPSEFSSAVRSPLANDTNHRVYWTNPGETSPSWNTYDRLVLSESNYHLGIVQPSTLVGPTVVAAGGTATIPAVSRAYAYTFVNEYGEESAPSAPSEVVSGAGDGTWTIFGLPLTVPTNPAGREYPPVVGLNLYRTITGTETGAQFFLVNEFVFATSPPSAAYSDTTLDLTVVNNTPLITTGWGNPPDGLDGLTGLSGGMLVGFTGNTVHFCEPNRPHAWPVVYDQSMHYDIVGLGVWQQSLVVLTEGFPSTGSGNLPSNYTFTMVRVPEPCISRGSIVTDLPGVYYASQNGLVMLNYYGMQSQTLQTMTKNIWLDEYKARDIIACRHRAQYLAINGTGVGFLIDYAEPRLGFMKLNTFSEATCIWNDELSGDAYIMAGKKVYRWDSPDTEPLVYRWRSKMFYAPGPVSLGACQIVINPSVLVPPVVADPPPLDDGDLSLALPAGINAVFRLYAGSGNTLVHTRNLTKTNMIFRIPGGFKAFHWQFEVVSRVKIQSVELASTMRELKGV
jgi:hypothetical protein